LTGADIHALLPSLSVTVGRLTAVLEDLTGEGFLVRSDDRYTVA
jgi:hypothetical protein